MMRSPGSFNSSFGAASTKTPPASDLLYRVRGRTSSSIADKPGGGNGHADWLRDAPLQGKPATTVPDAEKELERARKAIDKQTKLQNWLIEKEKRELLKLQHEQQFIDEQRRVAAEKDAKFYKHAAAAKKKLLALTAAADTGGAGSPKPSTAEL